VRLKHAEEALRARELNFQLIIESIPALVAVLTPTGEVEALNQPILDYLGRSFEELKDWANLDVVHPDDLAPVIESRQKALDSGDAYEFESRHRRADGVYRWFHVRGFPLKDTDGRILRWCFLLTDIDDRKRAEEALRERDHESRLIVDNIPGLVALLSATGEVEVVNRQSLDYFGQTLEELKQWGTNDTVHPEDLPNVIDVFSRSIAAGSSYEIVQRFKRSDGIYRWFQNRGFPVRDANGTVNRWCVLLTDIDDRVRAEEAVRESEHESRLIVDSIPGLVTVVTASGEIEGINRQLTEYVGKSPEEVKQWATNDIVHPEDLAGVSHAFTQYLTTGVPGDFEARLRRFDGVYRWFRARSLPLRDREGRIVRWYVLQTDIEDQKRAEDELRRKESFLATAQRLSLSGSFSWCPDTNEVTFSEGAYRIHEFEHGSPVTLERIGRRIHPDDRHLLQERVNAAKTMGGIHDYQIRLLMPDGSVKYLHTTSSEIQDASGRRQYIGAIQDITRRRLAEAQLAGEKRLLEMVASGCALTDVLTALCKFVEDTSADCHCGVYLIDWSGPKFRIGAVPSLPSTFNDPCEGLTVSLEVGPCGVAALTKTQVIVEDFESDPLFQSCAIRPLSLAHGFRSQWSTPILARDGRVMGTFAIFQTSPASPTKVQQDLIAQVAHIASIAIERALNEAALKRSEAFLAEAQHLSRIGSFAWRVATNEITWSEELYRIFEFDPHVRITLELTGTRIHPEDLTLFHDLIERATSSASDFQYEHRLLMPDHSIKYLHGIAHGTRNADGELEFIGAVQDVTNRRLSEEALGKARAELAHLTRVMSLGALTASIAHEVNQPLSGIITNANTCLRMLAANPPNVDGARETARRTIRDGDRAAAVITRLRALFSQKDATIESVDLNEATREVIALSLSELQRNRVILRSELADYLPPVAGDRVQLQQVILNLVRNATDAMSGVDDRPRLLLIRTGLEGGGQVRLSVQDAGVGFDPQVMDRLFDSFYTTKNDGMGIGLSVSRSIIASHNGRLWTTLNEGPGATFSFSIPFAHDV